MNASAIHDESLYKYTGHQSDFDFTEMIPLASPKLIHSLIFALSYIGFEERQAEDEKKKKGMEKKKKISILPREKISSRVWHCLVVSVEKVGRIKRCRRGLCK